MSEIRDTGIPSERDLIEPARRIFDVAFRARSAAGALAVVRRLARALLHVESPEQVEAVMRLVRQAGDPAVACLASLVITDIADLGDDVESDLLQ